MLVPAAQLVAENKKITAASKKVTLSRANLKLLELFSPSMFILHIFNFFYSRLPSTRLYKMKIETNNLEELKIVRYLLD